MDIPEIIIEPSSPPADYILSLPSSKWEIQEKPVEKSIKQFRKDLNKLKTMRMMMKTPSKSSLTSTDAQINNEQIHLNDFKDFVEEVEIKTIKITQDKKGFFGNPMPLLSPKESPSNPLIDETVRIIKPSKWIDCISRESKRVFVKDNWIVARIQLPTISKDQIGLKRLTLE